MKYRRKSATVEAWCNDSDPMPDWVADEVSVVTNGCLGFDTYLGAVMARPGDWIIRGVEGEIDVCKPDAFEATYEPSP
jgi:hypothetical protein